MKEFFQFIPNAFTDTADGTGYGPREVDSDGIGSDFFICWTKRTVPY
jgi:hypothetical protein